MTSHSNIDSFSDAVRHLEAGDFSLLEPLFHSNKHDPARVIVWHRLGLFASTPEALSEALSCASFLGALDVVEYLVGAGVASCGGAGTGLNALHWAANRGQLDVVRFLLRHGAPLETRSMYGSTVLGTAVWSAIHEPRPNHLGIIDELLRSGASLADVPRPTGRADVDQLLASWAEA